MSERRTRKGKRRALSKERVLKAALGLLDRSGLENLSMRRLAEKLGVEAMSLYKHIANKEELLDGVVDAVLSEIEMPPPAARWRDAMRLRALSARRVVLKHPWAATLIESRMNPGEVRLRYGDTILGFLRRDGFSIELAYRAFVTIDSYVYGFTLQEINWPAEETSRVQVMRALQAVPRSLYPHLLEAMDHVSSRRERRRVPAYDAEFLFGLDLILDGLERLTREPQR